MTNPRYNRWQGLAINQLSVSIALISGLSLSGLGACLSLLQSDKFQLADNIKPYFLAAFISFLISIISGCCAVISRSIDFRLTARKIRNETHQARKRITTLFWLNAEQYGKFSWFIFWISCLALLIGCTTISISVLLAFHDKLI